MAIGGTNLGVATGSIRISTDQLQGVAVTARQVGQDTERSLGRIATGAAGAQRSFAGMGSAATAMAGALGVSLGIAGAVQFGRFALSADAAATAYKRQSVAALNLAGSQEKLNSLLAAYDKATGGAIDRATALADVTRLQAVGFADSADELTRFATAARGISVAMGSQQDYVISQLQLAIANQSTMRLDQLGLGVSEVKNRIDALKASNRSMTNEMAYQQAILDLAIEKYGALATSAEGSATGAERARKSFSDLRLAFGEATGGAVSFMASGLAQWLEDAARDAGYLADAMQLIGRTTIEGNTSTGAAAVVPGGLTMPTNAAGAQSILSSLEAQRSRVLDDIENNARPLADLQADLVELDAKIQAATVSLDALGRTARGGPSYRFPTGGDDTQTRMPANAPRFNTEELAVIQEYADGRKQIEMQAGAEIADATRQYARQRADTIRGYEQTIAREAEDFGRQRARAEVQFQASIADARAASAERELARAAAFGEQIARARGDSAERVAEWENQRNEQIAKLREDSAKRLTDIEEDYQKSRRQAAVSHEESLLSAAGRLDARAIAAEQRRYALEVKAAEEANAEKVADEQEKLTAGIADANSAFAKRTADEARELQKRIDQATAAYEKERAAAADADAKRLEDMADDFAERQKQENEDRAVRLGRMAEDNDAQLAEMASAQADRIASIRRAAADEQRDLDDALVKRMDSLGRHTDAWQREQERLQDESIALFDKYWEAINKRYDVPAGGGDWASIKDPYAQLNQLPAKADQSNLYLSDILRELQIANGGARSASVLGLPGGTNLMTSRRGVSIGALQVTVNGGAFGTPDQIGLAVKKHMEQLLRLM